MTTATLIPNQTIVVGGAIGGGAASAHAAVTDGSDLTSINPQTPFVFGLTTTTLPAGGIVRTASLSGRGMAASGVDPIAMLSALRTADGTSLASFSMAYPANAGLFNVTGTPSPTLITDQTTLDGVQLQVQSAAPAGSALYLTITELSMSIIYCGPPTVTVGGPSGTITTASPTLSWTHNGDGAADSGGAQTRWHVKVFTAAQYDAAGFDPATSPAVYDSGEVVSGGVSTVVGPLSNAIAYKAYVTTAQNVNGSPHWSVWAAGPAFAVNTDPPVVATLVATVDDVAGRVGLVATRDPAHTNWTHANFERSVDGVTWVPVRGALAVDVNTSPQYVSGPVVENGVQVTWFGEDVIWSTATVVKNTVNVYDYEQPEGIPVWYRARGVVVSGSLVLSQGNWTTTGPVTWDDVGCGEWLRDPADPTGGVLVEVIVDEATATTEHRVGLLVVIGRASPVTVWDTPSLETGEMRIATRDPAAADALETLLRDAPVLLFQGRRDLGHEQKWVVLTNHTVSRLPVTDGALMGWREWGATYVEVDRPVVLS